MSSSNRTRKGFTLVELLVTITILAILASVTVVGYTNFIKRTAIEVDESLVKQLNIFTDAYLVKHYSNLPDDNRIIADVLDESGVKPLTLQSREYGYDLWFKCSEKTFELKENFLETEGYIRVSDNISFDDNDIEKPGTTTTTPGNTTNGDNNASEPTEDPVFILEDFGEKDVPTNSTYVYASNNALYVGIMIYDDGKSTYTELLRTNINVLELLSDGNYKHWDIKSIEYSKGQVFEDKILITESGTQEITLLLQDPETGKQLSHNITMYVRNICREDAKIESLDKLIYTLTTSTINDSTFDASITITGIKQYLKIYDYNPEISRSLSSSLNDEKTRLLPNMQIEIVINDESKIISGNDILEYPIKKTFNGLIGNPNEITCVVIYRYFGYNGITVEEKVPVNFKE